MCRDARKKLIRALARAPVLVLLLLMGVICLPTSVKAEEATQALKVNMRSFTTVGSYNAIETNGEHLNQMFDFKNGKLDEKRQYIAWYSIDRQKTSTISWSTKTVYLHANSWGTTTYKEDSNKKEDIVLKLELKGSNATPGAGKLTFYSYSSVYEGTHQSVGSGKVGTLFYFCVDPDTSTGKKFLKHLDKNDGTVSLKMSPVIQCSQGELWYTADAWLRGHPWGDQNRSHYMSHYDVPIRFEMDTIKITTVASIVGARKTEDSGLKYGADPNMLQDGKERKLTKDDYIFGPGTLLEMSKAENPSTDFEVLSTESFKLDSPVSGKLSKKNLTLNYEVDGKEENLMCVGYRIVKNQKDGTMVVLASTMIELTKDSSGQYIPYYVEAKEKKGTKTDKGADGEALSIPSKLFDRHVTIKRYNRYGSTKSGDLMPQAYFQVEDKGVSVESWLNDMADSLDWCLSQNFGVPKDNDNGGNDSVVSLRVDWFYAPTVSTPAEGNTITLESYYTTEKTNIQTKENPSVDDSKDLKYSHTSTNHKLYKSEVLDTVSYGSPWVSYSVKMNDKGQYVLKDGSVSPQKKINSDGKVKVTGSQSIGTKFSNTDPACDFTKKDLTEINNEHSGLTVPKIPYVLAKTSKSERAEASLTNYLYKVVVTTDEDDVWTEFTAEDIWGGVKPACGKITKGKSDNRSYVTNAPYMKSYILQTPIEDLGLIKGKDSDWQKDAFNMTHFILPEVRCNVTIKAYYTSTIPVQTFVYQRDGSGDFILQPSQTVMAWVSPGVTYKGTFSGNAAAVVAGTGRSAYSKPYAVHDRKKPSFSSVSAAEKYYSERMNIQTTSNNFTVKVKDEPIVVCVFIDNAKASKYFTQVQYVHTQDGQYHLVKAWRQSINTLQAKVECTTHYCSEEDCPGHKYENPSVTVKAFVSFPEYVSWDDGMTGLYGSLYSGQGIEYEYIAEPTFPQTTYQKPGEFHTSNNSIIYLTAKGNSEKKDDADRTPGGDNTLVCYCIYEDYFGWWENSQFNPDKDPNKDPDGEESVKNPQTTEDIAIPWNWELPGGFVWEREDITSKDTPDKTVYDSAYTNPFSVQVLSTQGSSAYQAQTAIPTTDVVRAVASVPRYLTRGYWTRHNLAWAYKVHAVYVVQKKETKTIESGNNDPDVGNNGHTSTENGPVYCTFDYYTSEPVVYETTTHNVERRAVYYTLGNAEVWDPQRVEIRNDVFSDSKITEDGLMTLFGNGRAGGYQSNARFFKTGDGAYQLPGLKVKRQYVNYGTYNDWDSAGDPAADLAHLKEDAEQLVDKFMVKNDTISFFDGLGKTYTLADGSEGLKSIVGIPSFPPEADMTYAGIFDSYNSVPEGIVVEPEQNNGNHETASVAYYRQIQTMPTNKYRTDELIKTKIADDGDDDVLVYTPAVSDSRLNLNYNNTIAGYDGIKLHPNYDFDQAVAHDTEQTMHNIQLDREYTMTLDVVGTASDMPGYGYQDYVRYLELDANGVPCTQVRFPFPVQMVARELKNGRVVTDDRYYYANRWIRIEMIDEEGNITGRINQTFFVPSWATEDELVTINFRSLARNSKANDPGCKLKSINNNDSFVETEDEGRHNAADERNYCAFLDEDDTVTGRIAAFQIVDVSDYPAWQSVFRRLDLATKQFTTQWSGKSYHSGISNEHGFIGEWGTMFTSPVVGTSNPAGATMGTLGLGYKVRYKITTVGPYYNLNDKITVKPEFYFVNDKGEYLQEDGTYSVSTDTRAKVDVYYGETYNGSRHDLVKVGSKDDTLNQKSLKLSDDAWSVSKSRIDFTNQTLSSSKAGSTEVQYTFGKVVETAAMRIINGDTHISAHRATALSQAKDASYDFNSTVYKLLKEYEADPGSFAGSANEELAATLTSKEVARSVQTWYGEYYLPSDVYVTVSDWSIIKQQIKHGFDGSEDCWLKGGHLVINFNPVLTSETKQTLKYDVSKQYSLGTGSGTEYAYGGCNQYQNENCVTSKLLASGEVIPLAPGDVIVYDMAGGGDSTGKAKPAKDAYDSSGSH